jgi:nucleoside-diphosphate-sugar epimerase
LNRVLVTGAGGYIGNILTRLLLKEGYQVRALDTFWFGEERLPLEDPNLEVVKGDIRSISSEIMHGVESIIDLAAISNDPAGELDPVVTWSINHLGRFRIASLGKAAGVSRYILPSSCSIYGFQDDKVDEESEVNPLTTYAKANLAAENDVLSLSSEEFCVTVVRQSTVYGLSERMRFDLAVNGMTKGFFENGKIPLMKDGTQWRPFVHVKDTSKAMMMMLEAEKEDVNGEIFNVGSDEQNYQIFNLAERVAAGQGIPFEYEWYGDPDHRSYRVRFDKIVQRIGFSPDFRAEDGALEVRRALDSGAVLPDDPSTITLGWYKSLIEKGLME